MTTGFTTHEGVCAPLRTDNIDTDQIIPSREMKTVSKTGRGTGLFAGWRYADNGRDKTAPNKDFVLNRSAYEGASILLGGSNFGCGSSREHAVWALRDFGIRVIIAESFGKIFRNNCARNRLLAIELPQDTIERIERSIAANPQSCRLTVDLERQLIGLPGGETLHFEVNAFDRGMLLKGLDYVDVALQFQDDIDDFVTRDRASRPWAHF